MDPEYPKSPHVSIEDLLAGINGKPLDDQTRIHLSECATCQEELKRWESVAGGVTAIVNAMPTPPELGIPEVPTEGQDSFPVDRPLLDRSRNRSRRVAALAAAFVVVFGGVAFGVNYAVGGSKAPADASLSNIILTSYTQATRSSAHISITVHEGQSTTSGTGAFDFQNRTGVLNLATHPASGPSVPVQVILYGNTVYTTMPNQPGKWLKAPLGASGSVGGTSQFQFLDPSSAKATLGLLVQSGLSRKASTLDGQPAEEYSGSIDISKLTNITLPASIANLPPIQISIWVDKSGTAEQIKTVINTPSNSPLHAVGPITETISFSDFGAKVSVTPPPASAIVRTITLPGLSGNKSASGTSPTA